MNDINLESYLDFNNSYIINQSNDQNSPRFSIESKCEIKNIETGKSKVFYKGQ